MFNNKCFDYQKILSKAHLSSYQALCSSMCLAPSIIVDVLILVIVEVSQIWKYLFCMAL